MSSKFHEEQKVSPVGRRKTSDMFMPFVKWLLVGILTVVVVSVTYLALVIWLN